MSDVKIVQRHKIVAFYGVTETSGSTTTTTFYRMKKFTQLAKSQNPIEYGRQYVDEPFGVTDVSKPVKAGMNRIQKSACPGRHHQDHK